VLAPCGRILENCNLEKKHRVMQKKMQIKNARKMQVEKRSLHFFAFFLHFT
jgi:hypothetical protein